MTLGTTVAAQAFTLVTGIIAARALGVEGRGTLALLWLVPVILSLIGGIGIPQATTYFIARNPEQSRSIIGKSARITGLACLLMIVLYSFALLLFAGSNHQITTLDAGLSIGLIPFFFGQNLAIGILLGQQRFPEYNLARLVPVVGYAVFSVSIVALGVASLSSILGAALAGWVIALAISSVQIARSGPDAEADDPVTYRQVASFGVRGVVGGVSPIDDIRLDQLLVGTLLDARALGLYVAAVAFCNLPRFIALSIGAVSYPRIAAERQGPAAWAIASRYLRIGLIVIAGFSAVVFLLVPVLLPLLFGSEFSDAVELGRILIVGAFLLALHRLLIEVARGLGHPGYGSVTEALNAVVFMGVLFGVLGAENERDVAWAVVAGAIVCSGVLAILVLRLRKPLVSGRSTVRKVTTSG